MSYAARLSASLLSLAMAGSTLAGIKLITLPPRERLEIQLDHPGATLVEEERIVPLAKGVNDVVFAWANTNVDKDSIQLRVLTEPETVKVLSVSYPPNENALTWQVASPDATSAKVRISYIIGQLSKTFSYRAVAGKDEKTLTLWQYILLHNQSNESFGESGMWAGFGERLERPIGVNETKQLLSAKFENVPVKKIYTADLAANGYLDAGKRQIKVPMHYVLLNDAKNGLGRFALPYGKARIFQEDSRGTEAFLGEDWAAFTPKDDELKLFLGVAKDIVVIRTIDKNEKKPQIGKVSNYDVTVKYEVENFKDQPVTLDLAENLQALRNELIGNTGRAVEWEIVGDGTLKTPDPEESTANRVLFHVDLPARGGDQKAIKQVHTLHIVIKNEW